MNTRVIGVTIAFTALTTALNFIKIPVPYLPYFSFQIGDIALVAVFLLFGPKSGVAVAFLSMVVSMTLFVGPGGFIGPPYYFIAILTMLLGVYISERLIVCKISLSKNHFVAKPVVLSTVFGILTRTLIMLPLDYTVFGMLVSFTSGMSISMAYATVYAIMPGIVLYNVTVPLYVIPTSYYISRKVSKSLKIETKH